MILLLDQDVGKEDELVDRETFGAFVMADIPGIIEGASEGKGLGLRFLRHIERNAVLLFLVPADADDINKEYEILLHELREFNPDLDIKNRVLAISKSDMLDDELRDEIAATLPQDVPHLFISAVTGQGLTELKDILWREINSEDNQARWRPRARRRARGWPPRPHGPVSHIC